jgi:hypothetical protein
MTMPNQSYRLHYLKWLGLGLAGFLLLFVIVLNPFHRGHFVNGQAWRNGNAIADALNRYAKQNGKYPDGNSSTEVFQKLLDDHFLRDPSVFYVPFPGKTKAASGQPLKPENVSRDFTSCPVQGLNDFSTFPLVFFTSCKVNYVPDGSAVALASSFPSFHDDHLTWLQEWNHDVPPFEEGYLLTVYPRGGGEGFKAEADGTIPHFISPDFNAHGKTYRQLTPDGELK